MAGKKRTQSRSGARKAQFAKRAGSTKKGNKKQYGGRITEANKVLKTIRAEKYNEKSEKRVAVLDDLMEKVTKKFNLNSKGKYALKRLVGTINISRLNDILSGDYKNAKWFHKRRTSIIPIDMEKTEANGGDIIYKSTNASDLIRSTQLGALLH